MTSCVSVVLTRSSPPVAAAQGRGETQRDHRQAEFQPAGGPGQPRPGPTGGPEPGWADPGLTGPAPAGTHTDAAHTL